MAGIVLNGKDRYVVYETTQKEHKRRGVKYAQTTHIRILELDHVVLFKRLLSGKRVLNRVNDPVVKAVVKNWGRVYISNYYTTKTVADQVCKQLNERIQND